MIITPALPPVDCVALVERILPVGLSLADRGENLGGGGVVLTFASVKSAWKAVELLNRCIGCRYYGGEKEYVAISAAQLPGDLERGRPDSSGALPASGGAPRSRWGRHSQEVRGPSGRESHVIFESSGSE